MATPVSFKDLPQGVALTCSVRSLSVATTGAGRVVVEVSDEGGEVLLSERYYPHGDVVRVEAFADLVESHMRASGVSYMVVKVKVTDAVGGSPMTADVPLVYCSGYVPRGVADGDVLGRSFLTTLAMRRVPRGVAPELWLWAAEGESLAWRVDATLHHSVTGEVVLRSLTFDDEAVAERAGVYLVAPNLSVVAAPGDDGKALVLRHMTVSAGRRRVSMFVDPTVRAESVMMFRNCFNVAEASCLPGVTTVSTDVERSLAVIRGEGVAYNVATTTTHEVELGPLTSDEADWLPQLVASPAVWLPSGEGVVITDSSCDLGVDGDDLPSAKLSWRYAPERQALRGVEVSGPFSSHFNAPFL